MQINQQIKNNLLSLARESLEQTFYQKKELVNLKNFIDSKLYLYKNGIFITILKNNEIRSCLGTIISPESLIKSLIILSSQIPQGNLSFQRIQLNELNDITLEISILTIPQDLIKNSYHKQIIIGKTGLILEYKSKKELFFPEVALKNNWNKREFLENIATKAELSPNHWYNDEVNLYTFKTVSFNESNIN